MAVGSIPSQSHAVSFESVKQADQTQKSGMIWQVILQYLADRPEENFATVERLLRVNGCFSRLIAADAPHPGQTPYFREQPRSYHLFIATTKLEPSSCQFLNFVADPATNLERLADTGILKPN